MSSQAWKPACIALSVTMLCLVAYHINQRPQVTGLMQRASSSRDDIGVVNSYQPRAKDNEVEGQKALNFLRANSHSNTLAGVDVDKMSATQLALTLHSYLDNLDSICRRKIRMGSIDDGGWEVCDDPEVRPVPPCLIYSLGTGHDWSFDEDASRLYGCHVFAVDPSLKLERHDRTPLIHFYPWGVSGSTETDKKGWQMYTLGDLRKKLGHEDKTIDIVKMDIEHSEWAALPEMISSGKLADVKQLLVEYHVTGAARDRDSVKLLQALERDGWGRFYVRKNMHCRRKQKDFPVQRTSCYEVTYYKKSLYH